MFSLAEVNTVPTSTITTTNGITTIDSRGSAAGGVVSGGSSGVHSYTFTTNVNNIDVLVGETLLTTSSIANATQDLNVWSKNVVGNEWNSAITSNERVNNGSIWGVTWEIVSKTGSIRQMAGISTDSVVSYKSLSHGLYQVNNKVYDRVYETGVSKLVYDITEDQYLEIGDRLGILVSENAVTYVAVKGNTVYKLYASQIPVTTTPLFWKGCMNRGRDSTGISRYGKAWLHTVTKSNSINTTIHGRSVDIISQVHVSKLRKLGMIVEDGDLYSNIHYRRSIDDRYMTDGISNEIHMTHQYASTINQDTKVLP